MIDDLFEKLLKGMTSKGLPLSPFGQNTAFHVVALICLSYTVGKVGIPWDNPKLGASVFSAFMLGYLLVFAGFWVCARHFGPLR